ncbi:MAG: flagellar export protein FliJ [Dissulfurimicrobium sp.]
METSQFELGRLFKEYSIAKDIIYALSEARKDADSSIKDRLSKGIQAGQYQLEINYLGALADEIERYTKILRGLELKIQKAKEALAMRHREKKLVERLKEKDFEAYVLKEQRDEQKKADDIAVVRYVKK